MNKIYSLVIETFRKGIEGEKGILPDLTDEEKSEFLKLIKEQSLSVFLYKVYGTSEYKKTYLTSKIFENYVFKIKNEITSILDAENIPFFFIKGVELKSIYKDSALRTMGDIDFMVKTDGSKVQRDVVKQIMLDNGYVPDVLDDGQVDAFKRDDNNDIYIEIHYEFMHQKHPHYNDFIVDWNSLLPTETDGFYKMSLSDLYYFNIGHFIKNMFSKGLGVKNIVDVYVLWHQLSKD